MSPATGAHRRERDREEVPEEVDEAEPLEDDADDWPSEEEHERDAGREARDAAQPHVAGLLLEEAQGPAHAHRHAQPAEEEHVTDREQRAVEEQHASEKDEQQPEPEQARADGLRVAEHRQPRRSERAPRGSDPPTTED